MLNFIIPGLYEHLDINILFSSILRTCPEFFYDNVNIRAVFGSFQYNTWDGGRVFDDYYHASKEKIEKIIHIYNNQLQIPCRFTFTSLTVNEDDCLDRFNNLVLELCQNDMNEVLVNSNILMDYIEKKYPKYHFVSSTTKCLSKDDALKEIQNEKYDMVCLDYNLNKNKPFLNSLTQEEKDKTEFLINAICPPGCVNRKNHYYLNSLSSKSYGQVYRLLDCRLPYTVQLPNLSPNTFTIEEIFEYEKLGFSNFKIEGRTFPKLEAFLNLVKYMVKPEYQYYIISKVLTDLNNFNLSNFDYDDYKKTILNTKGEIIYL